MQPLMRFAPRLRIDSVVCSLASRAAPRPLRTPVRPFTCHQCRTSIQVRFYAEQLKPSEAPGSSPTTEETAAKPVLRDVRPEELPSSKEGRRSVVTKRLSHVMDHLQGNLFIASQRINDLTGYSGIEALKQRITDLEGHVQTSQDNVRNARIAYKTTVAVRATTQKEVTTLMARKDSWTPIDLERFTSLYRMDHSNEQAVQDAATKLADSEREVEQAASSLSSSILSRYHEEQIWSDKIRRMSTWGTWGLMGVNILLFFVFQFGFEPWRRSRLVHGFEEKVLAALEKTRMLHAVNPGTEESGIHLGRIVAAAAADVSEIVEAAEHSLGTIAGETAISLEPEQTESVESADTHLPNVEVKGPVLDLRDPKTWTPAFQDLFSQRNISLRKQDVTLAAIEGAATGAAIVTIIATLIIRQK
ncbi:mitochondrion biogenesis protein-like protein [Calycina marina]|uniref:Sensitive to high expression protein 9, mitochondrial n=1 Tax=Calycina marina TaxID=1763456 RepID=A0A9P8CFN2_9HELO|nr:mitochondrion biogenesis protein-like protein [Calycina marina]